MNKVQAQSLIRSVAKTGCIHLSSHCKKRMLERNISTDDILQVLMWGKVTEIKKAKKDFEWKIRVTGKDLDNSNLLIVATVDKNANTLIVTVF